jgi:hypothetical protein
MICPAGVDFNKIGQKEHACANQGQGCQMK